MVKLSEQLFPTPWYRKYLLLIVVLIVVISSLAVWQLLFSNIQSDVTTTTIPAIITTTLPGVTTTTISTELESLVQEKVNQCKEISPGTTEELCYDLSYYDIAIANNDITLCEKIKDNGIKNDCYRSLR